MKITIREHQLGTALLVTSTPRSAGVHVSDLYNSLYRVLEPRRYSSKDGPHVLKMAMGLAWEAHLEQCLLAAGVDAQRPPECTTDEGIAFSPDLILGDGDSRVGEIKLTWMVEAETLDDPKFAKWLTQAKVYCYHLDIPRVRFYVLFVNGNYREQRDPVLRVYDIDFTARELQEEWQTLMTHGRAEGLL